MKALLLCLAAMPLLSALSRIYVTNSDDSKVSVIDPASDKVVDEIAVSPNPHGIVPSPEVPGSTCRARARMCWM